MALKGLEYEYIIEMLKFNLDQPIYDIFLNHSRRSKLVELFRSFPSNLAIEIHKSVVEGQSWLNCSDRFLLTLL